MKRRTLLGTIAGIGGTGVLSLSTGAFSYVNTDRSMTVEVVDDPDAYLGLNEVGDGGRSAKDGGKLKFRFPGAFEWDATNADGLGSDSVYRFAKDAKDETNGLFTVENRGTKPVRVFSSQSTTDDVPSVTVFDVDTGELLTENNPSQQIGVGEKRWCGLEIDTHGVDVRDQMYRLTLTIHAERN